VLVFTIFIHIHGHWDDKVGEHFASEDHMVGSKCQENAHEAKWGHSTIGPKYYTKTSSYLT